MTYRCDICCDSKRVTLPRYRDFEIDDAGEVVLPAAKEFDCPQCVPTVPYRRVRAMKVMTAYKAEQYGQFQMPIERGLAARFGEYLLREGLIRFSTKGSRDFGRMDEKIVITAHLGVVSPTDVKLAGAVPEIATTAAPKIPDKVLRRAKLPPGSVAWTPKPGVASEATELTDEFDEPKDALADRFSGLEI